MTNNYGELLVRIVDGAVEANNKEDGLRTHLGASVLGGKCLREVWFQFRWAAAEQKEGRMLRLLSRGQDEEEKFVQFLRQAGAEVHTGPAPGKQYRVSAFGSHLGGSMDGCATKLPNAPLPPGTWVLLEMKTHNEKSFKLLEKDGLEVSKPVHYKQAQLYMHLSGLKHCLYMAVNKNTDHYFFYLFDYDPIVGQQLVSRGETIIFANDLPPRISDNISFFECRFCRMKDVCHGFGMPYVNCRTCVHATAQRDGSWHCARGKDEIRTSTKVGCEQHLFNPAFFPKWHVTLKEIDEKGVPVAFEYSAPGKGPFVNGKNGIESRNLSLI